MTQRFPRPVLVGTTVCYPDSHAPEYSLERALAGIAAAGLRAVELTAIPGYCAHLAPAQMGPAEIEALQARLAHHDLQPLAVNAGTDPTTDAGVQLLAEAMRVAQALGAKVVVTSAQQTATEEGLAAFVARAPQIAQQAERYGVTVALETHRGHINSGVQGAALLRRLGLERLKLAYDTANVLNRGGVRPERDLAQMGADVGRYVGWVHLKDKATLTIGERIFPPFGEGVLDFGEMLRLLHEGGYRGPMSLEVELDGAPQSPEEVDEGILGSVGFLERYWG